MKTYIALLRGINVSGKNIIKMNTLKKIFEDLNFQKVTTYVQSGNVIFLSELTDTKKIEALILTQIEKELGLAIPVIVLTVENLQQVIDNQPFIENNDNTSLYFTFFADKVNDCKKENITDKKSTNEEIYFAENVVYLYCPDGYGKTKLTNTFLENKLKTTATTRNWKTTNELLKIAEQIKIH
jgi:uncharacterized protein (DUF1697 family)